MGEDFWVNPEAQYDIKDGLKTALGFHFLKAKKAKTFTVISILKLCSQLVWIYQADGIFLKMISYSLEFISLTVTGPNSKLASLA